MDVEKRPKYLPRIQVKRSFMVLAQDEDVNFYTRPLQQ